MVQIIYTQPKQFSTKDCFLTPAIITVIFYWILNFLLLSNFPSRL